MNFDSAGCYGCPIKGLTPNVDRMAREGIMFPNFHASGQRSFEGVQAVLTGLPALPGEGAVRF